MQITQSILYREQNPRPQMPFIKVNPHVSNFSQSDAKDLPKEASFLQQFIAEEIAKGSKALIEVEKITAKKARWLVTNEIHEVIIRPSKKQPSYLLVPAIMKLVIFQSFVRIAFALKK